MPEWTHEFDFLISDHRWDIDQPTPNTGTWKSTHVLNSGWQSGANPPFNDIETVAIRIDFPAATLTKVEFEVSNAGNPSRGAISTNTSGGPSFNLLNNPNVPSGIRTVSWTGNVTVPTLRLYLGHANNYGTRSYIRSVKITGLGANPFVRSGDQRWCAEFDFLVSAGGWMGDEPSSGSWNSIHKVGFGWESGANPPFNDIETVAIRRNDLNNAVLRHVEFLVNNAGNPSRGAISTNSTGGPSFNLLNAPGIPTGIQPVTWWGDG